MKLSSFFFHSLLCLLFATSATAQMRNMDKQMRDFLNTPFMIEYQKLQLEMRTMVKDFVADKDQYSTTDFRKVRDAYNLTSRSFNDVLYTIEADMLNKHTRRTMQRSPDLYYSKLQLQMGQLKDIYAREFLQTLADVRSEPVSGGLTLAAVTTLTQLTASIVDFFLKARMQSAQFNQAFVRDRLIQPYSFPNWDQLIYGRSAGQWANENAQNGNYGNTGNDYDPNATNNGSNPFPNDNTYGNNSGGNYGDPYNNGNGGNYGNSSSNNYDSNYQNNNTYRPNNGMGSPAGSITEQIIAAEVAKGKEGN